MTKILLISSFIYLIFKFFSNKNSNQDSDSDLDIIDAEFEEIE